MHVANYFMETESKNAVLIHRIDCLCYIVLSIMKTV